jgi:hypothetical protein
MKDSDPRLCKSKQIKEEQDVERASPGRPTRTRLLERLSIKERLTQRAPLDYKAVGTRPDAVPHEVGAARMQPLLFAWKHIRMQLKAQALSMSESRSSIAAVVGTDPTATTRTPAVFS